MAARAPVDDVVAFVDQALVVEGGEDLDYGLGQAFIHGEALAVPVAGAAQAFELVDDLAAGLLPPGPDPLDEFFAAQLVTIVTLGLQVPLDDILGGDAGVVGAWHPEDV